MATKYTLYFSDSSKTEVGRFIEVEGTKVGPGKNNYDTSLELVGPGYPYYGQAVNQNFIKLLENFASPHAPIHAIEGQLWYDTSDVNKKVLRINNGNPDSSRWPSVSGIYQQANDPANEYTKNIAEGDIWVDIASSQLKIRYGSKWLTVGPGATGSPTTKTGNETLFVESNTGTVYPIILNWANGKVVEVISFNDFTPRTVIEGFSTLKPGTNLTNKVNARYNGVAEKAASLEVSAGVVIPANNVMKNRATYQVHTGTLVVESAGGLSVRNPIYNQPISIYSTNSGAVINFADSNSTFKIGIGNDSYIRFNSIYNNVGINTATNANSPTLDVYGGARFLNTVTIASSATIDLNVFGGINVGKNATISNNLTVKGSTYFENPVIVGNLDPVDNGTIIEPAKNDTYDLGSFTKAFRTIYVQNIGTTGTTVKIYGQVTTATTLTTPRSFSIQGQIENVGSAPTFNGSDDVVFTTQLTKDAISDQTEITSANTSHSLLVVDTVDPSAELRRITKSNFLKDIVSIQTGMMLPYPVNTPPTGFLLCDGTQKSMATYPALSALLGTTYGAGAPGFFVLPNMTNVTLAVGSIPIFYIIKT